MAGNKAGKWLGIKLNSNTVGNKAGKCREYSCTVTRPGIRLEVVGNNAEH